MRPQDFSCLLPEGHTRGAIVASNNAMKTVDWKKVCRVGTGCGKLRAAGREGRDDLTSPSSIPRIPEAKQGTEGGRSGRLSSLIQRSRAAENTVAMPRSGTDFTA